MWAPVFPYDAMNVSLAAGGGPPGAVEVIRGLTVLEPEAHASLARRVLAVLGPLDRLPEGAVLRRRLAALVGDFDTAAGAMEEAYCEALRRALARVVDLLPGDGAHVTAIIETIRPPLSRSELEVVVSEALDAAERDRTEPDPREHGARKRAAEPETERQYAAIYRHQLESHSRDIEALQSQLYRDAEESIRYNREAGELLDSLITRLQLSSDLPEVIESRDQFSQDLSRIAHAHQAIARKLEDTLRSLHSISADHERLHDELRRVRTLSLTDEGTDLPNRRAFMRQLSAEIARASRDGGSFSLALVDLDRFKVVNDRHGHGAGDAVLVHYAREILSVFRTQDLVARYGGEEFAVLLPSTSEAGGIRALEKAQEAGREAMVDWQGQSLPVPTFSAGVAQFRRGDTAEALLQRADRALYAAKRAGRDRVLGDAVNDGDGGNGSRASPAAGLIPHTMGNRSEL